MQQDRGPVAVPGDHDVAAAFEVVAPAELLEDLAAQAPYPAEDDVTVGVVGVGSSYGAAEFL